MRELRFRRVSTPTPMDDSKELDTLLECRKILITSIRNNLQDISVFMRKENIISKQTFDEVTDVASVVSPEYRAQIILRQLENKIEEDDAIFKKFMKYISTKEQYSRLRTTLAAEYSGEIEGDVPLVEEMDKKQPRYQSEIQRKKLTLRNIKNVLKEKEFSSADAGKLGLELDEVSSQVIETIKHDHGGIGGSWDSILTAIISHWLNNDVEKSWNKLAKALNNCDYKVIGNAILGTPPNEGLRQRHLHVQEEYIPIGSVPAQVKERDMPQPGVAAGSGFDRTKVLVLCACIVIGIGIVVGIAAGLGRNNAPSGGGGGGGGGREGGGGKYAEVPTPSPEPRQESPAAPSDDISTNKKTVGDPVAATKPHQGSSNEPPDNIGTSGCTKIIDRKHLEKVLKEVGGVNPDKMCLDLKIKSGTCNTMDKKDMFTLSRKYMEQNPDQCWENIIMILCEDFDQPTLAETVRVKYGVPKHAYSKYCEE